MDGHDEVEILLNGRFVDYAAETANNAWEAQTVVLPDDYVNDVETNLLTFASRVNPPLTAWWGVSNVAVNTP